MARGVENEDDEIDEVWCVFDVEWPKNHPKLNASLQLAHSHGVQTAVSNPCFEYWLVLHFEQPLDWLTSKDAEKLRQQFDQSKGKEVRRHDLHAPASEGGAAGSLREGLARESRA